MSNLRFLFITLTAWLIVLLNIGNINVLDFTVPLLLYVTVTVWMVLLLIIPSIGRMKREMMVAAALLIYSGMRYFAVLSDSAFTVPTLITELVILTFTLWLTHKFVSSLSNVETTYSQLVIGDAVEERVFSTAEGIDAVNHELFRARKYERPVALMVIRLPRIRQLVERIGNRPYYQMSLEHQFIKTRVSKLVASLTYSTDTLLWQGDNLILCLPETDREQAIKLARQITRLVTPSLNLELPIGIAVFPGNGLVFDDLVRVAESNLNIYTDNDKVQYLSSFENKSQQSDADDSVQQPASKANFELTQMKPSASFVFEGFQNFKQLVVPMVMTVFSEPEANFGGTLRYAYQGTYSVSSTKQAIPTTWIDEQPFQSSADRERYIVIKRIIDVSVILLLSPILIPVMLLISLLIYAQDRGPVVFVQERTGYGGHRFKMYKFRTMVTNAEALLKDLEQQGLAVLDANGKLAQPLKLKRDPRVTSIGRILRKTSLDELPQLLNVLLGEMSIVGPRPTSWDLNSYKLPDTNRLTVLPGLTGLWQLFDRGSHNFDSWVEWDLKYINKMSFWVDLQIILRTVLVVLKRKETTR